ncbi:uncharacterized protein zgc:113691 [Pangasianodon hypophthalmus]|uniref:uncharacterized protein zgc:113691 n=1 Tax=Pangasianodon hypophthalmus TaxID=310915 RepID=UPI000EFE2592|nr:uncharacterized protein zgc:113691 [Pangasianodon hypophthalmus]
MMMARKVSVHDTQKLVEQYRSERDEAIQRENALKEKLRQYESRIKSTETVKQKLKTLTLENKELRRQVKTLRTEIGLESSPNFQGKTTKDIISDLQEKERECNALVEKAGRLNLTIDELSSELANAVTSKTLLEEKVQSLQLNLRDMTNNQRRLLKLWEDKKAQREPILLPAITPRTAQKPLAHKAVQTDTSISSTQILPANVFETRLRWEPEKTRNPERRNITLPNGSHSK